MKHILSASIAVVGVLAAFFAIGGYLLFHGYFDHGTFVLRQIRWSPDHEVAMIAERWDHDAFGSLEYFVVVGDHRFSPRELRSALYSDAVILNVGADCLDAHWSGSKTLVVACKSAMDRSEINPQVRDLGDIHIVYRNIPILSP